MKTTPYVALLLLCCLRPSDERAARDLEVGQATSDGVTLSVDDGLCAVRTLDQQRIVLWASAPAWAFTLDHPGAAGETVELEIQNAMPDGVLSGDGAAIEELGGAGATRKQYRLTLGGSSLRLAFAPPNVNQEGPFRFALLSDVQEAIDRVGDIYERINAEPYVAFLLGAGDLTERGSHEELRRFQDELLALSVPYYTTLGNHELGQSPTLYHEYFGRGSFSFEYRRVRFTLLDSASATIDPTVYDWLDGWLARGMSSTHVVSMHIAPIDPTGVRNGSFASRPEAAKLLGRLAAGGVDLTVYGHVHSWYDFENAGIQAFISGGGGAVPERFDNIGRHFMVFDVDSELGLLDHELVQIDKEPANP
jgi:3',5'-cyclic-AMP phosphodiesterase